MLAALLSQPLPAALAAGLAAYLLYRAALSPRRTRVIAADTHANRELVAACPALAAYPPTPWLPGGHLNTIGAAALRAKAPGVVYTRTHLRVSDGGVVALDWLTPGPGCGLAGAPGGGPALVAGQPVLIALHGLTGGSHERYVQWCLHAAAARGGLACVVMTARGCAGSPLVTPVCFNASRTGDVRETVAHVRSLVGPGTPVFAVGFSLGAGILTKFVGEDGDACDLTGAAAVAAAFDLAGSGALLEAWPGRVLYGPMLTHSLQRYFARQLPALRAMGAAWVDVAGVRAARTVRQYDAAAVVPQFGYADVDAYYADASAGRLLASVRVPLLVLNAADDPVCNVGGLTDRARDVLGGRPRGVGHGVGSRADDVVGQRRGAAVCGGAAGAGGLHVGRGQRRGQAGDRRDARHAARARAAGRPGGSGRVRGGRRLGVAVGRGGH